MDAAQRLSCTKTRALTALSQFELPIDLVKGQESRSRENTTETSIEEFAKAFAAAYAA